MAKQPLAEVLMALLMSRPEVTRVQKKRSPCGRCKRRVKITRHQTGIILGITEPDHPRYDVEVESMDVVATAAWMDQHLTAQRVEVINK